MADLAYIIPTHKKTDTLVEAVDSALAQEGKPTVIVVGPSDVLKTLGKDRSEHVVLVEAEDDTSYAALVNLGLAKAGEEDVGAEWVSILEHDDALLPYATRLFGEYRDHFSETNVFAGLTLVVEGEERKKDQAPALKALANEAAWAPNIMEEPGVVDFNAMLRMNFVLLNSCFFKLELLDEVGVFKTNMKHFGDYEFLLRLVYNGYNIRAIPKATHYHYTGGEGSKAQQSLTKDEGSFWVGCARKEYFFEFDRELEYTPTQETETSEA